MDGLRRRNIIVRVVTIGWKRGETYALDYTRAHSRDMSLDHFVARGADHQGAPGVYRRKKRITVLQAMFELGEGVMELFDEPVELPRLFKGRVNE